MSIRLLAVSAVAMAALALPATGAAARTPAKKTTVTKAATKKPVATTSAARETSSGSVIVGSANAPKKLVEYISYTCSHCAHFVEQSSEPIKPYVASGKASVEYRSFMLNPFDFAAALLVHCGGVAKFEGNHQLVLKSQHDWIGKVQAATDAQQNAWSQGTYTQRLTAIATDAGLIDMMQTRGITPAQSRACLANENRQAQLLAMNEAGEKQGVTGTPAIFINGVLQSNYAWTTIKAALD